MAEPKTNELMDKIVALCKRRGFIFQSSEIYGGLNGFWDYGPLGAELKRNVKDLWWRSMVHDREDVAGLEATIIMHPTVWRASGHVDTFSDPMCDCLVSGKRFRADQVEPLSGEVYRFLGAVERDAVDRALGELVDEAVRPALDEQRPKFESELLLAEAWRATDDPTRQRFGTALLAALEQVPGACDVPCEVLAPEGTVGRHAYKVARLFYERRGMKNPVPRMIPQAVRHEANTTRFNPERGPALGAPLSEPRPFNLMFKTYVGPVADEDSVAFLRPETAQAIFVQFKNVLETSRQKVPFGIAQIGKAFRNEVTPRNFTFRSREFEQMELEFFIRPDEVVGKLAGAVASVPAEGHPGAPRADWGWQAWHKYWVEERIRWYGSIGLPRTSLEEYWQKKEELAHYAKATVDILYKFPFGTQELEGIAARGDFDLSQHQSVSGKSMEYFDDEAKAKYVPHVIEPSAGVDRLILALICHAYAEDEAPDDKGRPEKRVVMRFHPRVAPIKVAVFPLLKNRPELVAKARAVRDLLRPHLSVFYDEAGAIGRRYRRQDEAGTPFGVTIDFDTLGEKGPELKDTVTLRDRDSMQQTRVRIDELLPWLLDKVR